MPLEALSLPGAGGAARRPQEEDRKASAAEEALNDISVKTSSRSCRTVIEKVFICRLPPDRRRSRGDAGPQKFHRRLKVRRELFLRNFRPLVCSTSTTQLIPFIKGQGCTCMKRAALVRRVFVRPFWGLLEERAGESASDIRRGLFLRSA